MNYGYKTVNGRSIWVEERGSGPLILFIHGLGGTGNVFDPQADVLAHTHRVVTFDLAGHGMSEMAAETSVEGWASDVLALIAALDETACILVAHSLGTLVAQRVIELAPDTVIAAALLGPVRDLAEAGRAAQRDRAALVRSDGMAAVAHTISRGAVSARTLETQPLASAFIRELLQRQPAEGYAAACEALGASTPPDVAGFRGRVLAITGTDDGVSPPDRIGDFAGQFRDADSQTIVVHGIGHWTSIEAAAEVTEALVRFCADA